MKSNILHPHGKLTGVEVIIDYLDDNLRRLKRYLETVSDEGLHWQVNPETNSIAINLWHMGRLLDVFHTRLAMGQPAETECWFRNGWARETGYDPRGLGREGWGSLNEYTPEEVAAMPKFTREQVLGYLDDVYANLRDSLRPTPWEVLAEPGTGFDGRFTRYQIISMALMDNVRHLGEIRLIKSLWEQTQTHQIA